MGRHGNGRTVVALALVFLLAAVAAGRAAEGDAGDGKGENLPEVRGEPVEEMEEERLDELLEEPVLFRFEEKPVTEVMDFLRDYLNISVVVHQETRRRWVEEETTVTFKVNNIPLWGALELLAKSLDLNFEFVEERALYFGPRQRAEEPVARLRTPYGRGGMLEMELYEDDLPLDERRALLDDFLEELERGGAWNPHHRMRPPRPGRDAGEDEDDGQRARRPREVF